MTDRWRAALKGMRVKPGRWDPYVALAERYGWPPAVVDRLDVEFVAELEALAAAKTQLKDKG